jgi:hypothetical protein
VTLTQRILSFFIILPLQPTSRYPTGLSNSMYGSKMPPGSLFHIHFFCGWSSLYPPYIYLAQHLIHFIFHMHTDNMKKHYGPRPQLFRQYLLRTAMRYMLVLVSDLSLNLVPPTMVKMFSTRLMEPSQTGQSTYGVCEQSWTHLGMTYRAACWALFSSANFAREI